MDKNVLRIGPSGNSNSFYAAGKKHTQEAAEWLSGLGLNAYEYSFGRGISMRSATAEAIGAEMTKYGIAVSAHAPYYINLVKTTAEDVLKSFGYVAESVRMVKLLGGRRVVIHPGYVGEFTRPEAMLIAQKNLESLLEYLAAKELTDYTLCIETMGKHSQLGTAEEVLSMVKPFENIIPCFDFGHINTYSLGGLKTKDDYRRILDLSFTELGPTKALSPHIHFSKIMYGPSGEIKHLTFEDTQYGPDYAPLAQLIDEYGMTPVVICESDGTMAEDALYMKSCHVARP